LALFSKTIVMIYFLQKLAAVCAKSAFFFAKFFSECIFLNNNIGPRPPTPCSVVTVRIIEPHKLLLNFKALIWKCRESLSSKDAAYLMLEDFYGLLTKKEKNSKTFQINTWVALKSTTLTDKNI
jgi:hypothetical protein